MFDLILHKLDIIHENIYKRNESIKFPYLFDRRFMLDCASSIKCLDLMGYKRFAFYASLIQDRLIYELKDTPLYVLLKSFEPTRNLANSLTAFTKVVRNDKKSS